MDDILLVLLILAVITLDGHPLGRLIRHRRDLLFARFRRWKASRNGKH